MIFVLLLSACSSKPTDADAISLSCGLNVNAAGNLYFDFADPHGNGAGGSVYFGASTNSPSAWFTGSPGFGALMVSGNFPTSAYVYGYGNTLVGQAAAVPEPSSGAMLAVGFVGLVPLARRAARRNS